MSGFLFDSNVLLDIITANVTWRAWSKAQLTTATAQRLTLINPLIYAELAPAFVLQDELDRWLGPADFQRLPPPYSAGWQSGRAFV